MGRVRLIAALVTCAFIVMFYWRPSGGGALVVGDKMAHFNQPSPPSSLDTSQQHDHPEAPVVRSTTCHQLMKEAQSVQSECFPAVVSNELPACPMTDTTIQVPTRKTYEELGLYYARQLALGTLYFPDNAQPLCLCAQRLTRSLG